MRIRTPADVIVLTRARFIEDLVAEQISQGQSQFVIFAAELDT
ncbi:class I SAM-dependent methyltransferase [Gimesia maris]|nr:class I SAM-dependent methyltransferase [Gimesia maris]